MAYDPAPMSDPSTKRKKIVILGGGLGGLATAFWLTEKKGWEQEYEICIYQMGWRLGGKCASARNLTPGYADRIEEHGLHMLFGFYENAFLTVRRAFDTLRGLPNPPVQTFDDWSDAFKPHSLAILPDRYNGRWVKWPIVFPPRAGEPGTGGTPSLWRLVRAQLEMMESLYRQFLFERLGVVAYPWSSTLSGCLTAPLNTAATLLQSALDWIVPGRGAAAAARDEIICDLAARYGVPDWCRDLAERPIESTHGRLDLSRLRTLCAIADAHPEDAIALHASGVASLLADGIRAFLDIALAVLAPLRSNDEARMLAIVLDLGGTTLIGMLRDQVLPNGFETLDDVDFRDWIRSHGARPETLDSRFLMAWYDMAFAFEGGDTTRPNAAAGTALLGMMRLLFGYKGSFAYKMQAGMGDTICTLLYGVLRARGVRFEFFHRVDRLVTDPNDRQSIAEIHLTQQAELTTQAKANGYWPLVRVLGLDCWPSEPDLAQLTNGAQLKQNPAYPFQLESNRAPWPQAPKVVLTRGTHFDTVVLAIPVGALDRICDDLVTHEPRWRAMLEGDGTTPPVGTVRTLALQLWQRRLSPVAAKARADAIRRAGWDPNRHRALLSGYTEPFDTWSDMTDLLARETWPTSADAGGLVYCCGPMRDAVGAEPTDPIYLLEQMELVRKDARAFLVKEWGGLWPEFMTEPTPPGGQWNRVLVDPGPGIGDALDRQFFRANVDPSDRYVGIFAGTTKLRLPPGDSGFANLVLAGDWVLNPVLSAGSVEPTFASGMAASRAISGFPQTIYGERP